MKYISLIILVVLVLGACEPPKHLKIVGYLVAKEIVPQHMSNETPNPISVAYVPVYVPHIPAPQPAPHKVDRQLVWYVANKQGTNRIVVADSMRFASKHLGDTVHITYH